MRPRRPNWFLWFVIVSGASLLIVTAFFFAFLSGMTPAVPSLGRGTTLSIDLARAFPEDTLYDMSGPFLNASDLTFRDLLFGIRAAKEDARIERLFLHVRGTRLGWANTFELRSRLLDFKSAGKPITAFIEYASNRDYALASAADEVFLHPRGNVDLRGIRAQIMFVKSSLDKLGVEAEFERFGAYKDGPDMYLRESMSPESREAIGAVVETLHEALVDSIVEGRNLESKQVERALSSGPLTADEAVSLGLVDGLKYWDEVQEGLSLTATESETISIDGYQRVRGGGSSFTSKGRIAIIYGIGAIVGGSSGEDTMFGRVMGSDTIAKAFRTVREDDSVDAVVFRIDSPGGSDVASDVIWREAMLTDAEKPVVVSMGNVAASGGYWIAMASDQIVAEATTITGSIGIYGGKFNLAGLYDKVGVSHDGVSSTPNADFFSDSRSFTEQERQRFRALLENGYDAFLERVATARGKTIEEVDALARGRVWSGKHALEHGLIDELGGIERAISLAKEAAGYEASDRFELAIYPKKQNVFEALLGGLLRTRGADSGLSESLLRYAASPHKLLEGSPLLQSLVRGERLALMPFDLELR